MGLTTKTVMVGLDWKNIKRYEELGYYIPRRKDKHGKISVPRGTKIEVKIEDLPKGSNVIIEGFCDGCGENKSWTYNEYNKHVKDNGKIYCHCCTMKLFNSGENHFAWNPNKTDEEREKGRHINGQGEFIRKVLDRDNYTCQCCGKNKKEVNIVVHHLDGYNWCLERRNDFTNGITLCENCHNNFHSIYGKGNNTKEQFEEWIGYTLKNLDDYDKILPSCKRVYCYEEDKIYESALELAKEWNISFGNVYSTCNNKKYKLFDKHIIWYLDYINMTNEEKEEWVYNINNEIPRTRKVVCLNNGKVFDMLKDAEEFYNATCITECCRKQVKSSGTIKTEKLVWRYYEDYILLSKEEIDNIIYEANKKPIHNRKMVICLTTGEVFISATDGQKAYKLKGRVSNNCCGFKKSCGKLKDGTKLVWKYIKDLTEEEYIKYDVESKVNKILKEMV